MKYRTVLELICEATDKEEASNLVGDYLRGDVDFGVEMKCKTLSVTAHRVKKYAAGLALVIIAFSTLLVKVTPLGCEEKIDSGAGAAFRSTYTVMPVLKTKHRSDFRDRWMEKKDEMVLEYLKK